jgi:hypothetical protein
LEVFDDFLSDDVGIGKVGAVFEGLYLINLSRFVD